MIAYYKDVVNTIEDSLESIDEKVYEQIIEECVETLKNGGKIIASGLGKNVPICEKFVGTLNSLGIDARFLHTNTAVHGDLGMVGKKDIVFLLTKGGNTSGTSSNGSTSTNGGSSSSTTTKSISTTNSNSKSSNGVSKLPYTGIGITGAFVLIVVAGIAVITYRKYNYLKGIK